MKHFRRLSLIFTLMVLSSVICRAGDSIHIQSIDSMYRIGELVTAKPYKVGITDFVTYTITGAGKDTRIFTYGSVFCICLPDNGDFVTTTKITNLKRLWFVYSPYVDYLNGSPTMQILVSKDSTDWSDLSSIATHAPSSADVTLPSAGDYYVRIKNSNTKGFKPLYLRVLNYVTQHCNCFRYQP